MLLLYRYLLHLYPPAYRCEFGEEMIAVFREIGRASCRERV